MPPRAGGRAPDAADTEASLITRAQAGDVGAFERLSGAYADRLFMLLLRLLGDLSIEQIAGTLGKSKGAVKALQRRGLAAVGRLLEREGVPL